MKILLRGLIWALAFLALMATSRDPSGRYPAVTTTTLPTDPVPDWEVRIRCETVDAEPCQGFKVHGDTFIETAEGLAYLMRQTSDLDPRLSIFWPTDEVVSHPSLKATGLPHLFEFVPPALETIATESEIWSISIDAGMNKVIVGIAAHQQREFEPSPAPNCRDLDPDLTSEKVIAFRNIIALPGALVLDARIPDPTVATQFFDYRQLKLYNDAGVIIPTTFHDITGQTLERDFIDGHLYISFDSSQTLTRVEIPAQDISIYICSQDLGELENRIKFTKVQP